MSYRKMGRPLKFKTPEELLKKANKFFDDCDESGDPYTITGLALALDTTRETLLDYQNNRSAEFSDAVKKIKLRCQHYIERLLVKSRNQVGAIFWLKNNGGWVDVQHIDTKQDITVTEHKSEVGLMRKSIHPTSSN